MKLILVGAALIAAGVLRGESLFLGDFAAESWFFDGLGAGAMVWGLIRIYRQRRQPGT